MIYKLLRLPNLIIVAATQYIIYIHLLTPIFEKNLLSGSFNNLDFFLFVLTTLCITAAGYIINDIYDVETDKINKPQKRIINNHLSITSGWNLYVTLLILGAILSLFLAIQRDEILYWFIYPLSNFVLFAYSRWLKGIPMIGNIIVSFFCGAVPGIFFLSEASAIEKLSQSNFKLFKNLETILFSYVLFAFFTNFYREIVKDLQDEHGDKLSSINTAAVLWGKRNTKFIAIFIAVSTSFFIHYTFSLPFFINIPYLFMLQLILVQFPLLLSLLFLIRANNGSAFKKVGLWIKLIMVNGLFLITYLIIQQNG